MCLALLSATEYIAVNGLYSGEQPTQQYIFSAFTILAKDLKSVIKPESLQSFWETQQGYSKFSLSLMVENLIPLINKSLNYNTVYAWF